MRSGKFSSAHGNPAAQHRFLCYVFPGIICNYWETTHDNRTANILDYKVKKSLTGKNLLRYSTEGHAKLELPRLLCGYYIQRRQSCLHEGSFSFGNHQTSFQINLKKLCTLPLYTIIPSPLIIGKSIQIL